MIVLVAVLAAFLTNSTGALGIEETTEGCIEFCMAKETCYGNVCYAQCKTKCILSVRAMIERAVRGKDCMKHCTEINECKTEECVVHCKEYCMVGRNEMPGRNSGRNREREGEKRGKKMGDRNKNEITENLEKLIKGKVCMQRCVTIYRCRTEECVLHCNEECAPDFNTVKRRHTALDKGNGRHN